MSEPEREEPVADPSPAEDQVAILAMAGRFPGARDVEELWRNLCSGVESITFFSDAELAAAGVPGPLIADPAYVKAKGVLPDADLFDAGLFGFTPREAERTDPQHRLVLECAWEALEAAGYGQEEQAGPAGVFLGAEVSDYLPRRRFEPDRNFGSRIDFLATRVSYKLNLRGPSLTVQTACSTSLVALHLACKSLLDGECDLALAGGASLDVPQQSGRLFQEGGVYAPDGHCRTFDAGAQGMVPGNGVGVVVLKRLEDALAAGDPIRAVIRGSAVNNDGAGKVGFTAPSAEGQARVITEALGLARVGAGTIGYVEAHGTATPLGDPIEIAALTQAFRETTRRTGFCAIGSIKTNIGHLGVAAGVVGLIKAVLAVERGMIPPSLHFRAPNPCIDFAGSPFYVNDRLSPWPPGDGPRRAGVSSFGMGGTNAHLILEEAPAATPLAAAPAWQLLPLSARTPGALAAATERLAHHLETHPDLDLADMAHTLQAGRRSLEHRRAVVCADRAGAVAALRDGRRATGRRRTGGTPQIAFLFPGQGEQRPGMGRGLYTREPAFREPVDRCREILCGPLGFDLLDALFPRPDDPEAAERLARTAVAQPALFVLEYALSQLWLAWGVRPTALLGHSLGEYVAACLAGVFTLEEALALVAARGKLMAGLPRGAMLAVPLPEHEVVELLGSALSLAAVNAPRRSVVAGPEEAVAKLEERLRSRGVGSRRLATSHAFHSAAVEPILAPFAARVHAAKPRAPRMPFLSNVTGTWISDAEATDPGYWVRHLRSTVRFADGILQLAGEPDRVFLEVGPGDALCRLARQAAGRPAEPPPAFPCLPGGQDGGPDGEPEIAGLLRAVGGLWLTGARIEWTALQGGGRRRVALPTYPFERSSYWLDSGGPDSGAEGAEPGGWSVRTAPRNPESRPGGVVATGPADTGDQRTVGDRLRSIFGELFGVAPEEVATDRTFLEMGADSLSLLRASHEIQQRLGSRVPFRRLLEDLSTVADLAAHLAREGVGEAPPATAAAASAPPPERPARPAFVPYQPIPPTQHEGLDARQREHLQGLIERLTARTQGSKERAAAYRHALASNRTIAGFRRLWKELIYPLVASRGAGSRIWDVDGNEYVDLTMGFGSLLFGHSPDFLQAALREQIEQGLQIGPESEVAGEVAELIRELTGVERVTFCNSGTEAVMAALRLARTVTGRRKVALFAGSYHGTFDGVLAKQQSGPDGRSRTVPMAPGIPPSLIGDVLVLDYQGLDSLAVIEAHAGELAAVLVEPRQSRRLELDNRELLRRLRDLTQRAGIALIFDEVVTGFRVHPGGLQVLYGVRADLVTYGKAVANGMPIGVVAGTAAYMDAIDGGPWSYGDSSVPEAEITFFTGTFFRHPLVMAAARAVLLRLRQEPELQQELSAKTDRLASALSEVFAEEGLPVRVVHFGSVFSFRSPRDWTAIDLLFYHLLEKGIYIWEGRICYLSTAHTEEDLRRVVEAVRESARELRRGGFLADAPQRLPLTEGQKELWELARFSETVALTLNLPVGFRLRGRLERAALERALQRLVDRHEALRVTFDPDGESQLLGLGRAVELAWTDLQGSDSGDRDAEALLAEEGMRPFDLIQGPLARFHLIRLDEDVHILALFFHHLVVDGPSMGVLLDELSALYSVEITSGEVAGRELCRLPPAEPYRRFIAAVLERESGGREMDAHEAYWVGRFSPPPPPLELPADRPQPEERTFRGDWRLARLDPDLVAGLRRLAQRLGCTTSTLLLAAVAALLHRLTDQDDLVVGLPVADHPAAASPVVGYCTGLLALRSRIAPSDSFADLAAALRTAVLDGYDHRSYPYSRLLQRLGLGGVCGPRPLIAVLFNYDALSGVRLGDLALEIVKIPTFVAEFELFWNFVDTEQTLLVECCFNTDLFNPATIERWQGHLRRLLAGVTADPDRALGDLDLDATEESEGKTMD